MTDPIEDPNLRDGPKNDPIPPEDEPSDLPPADEPEPNPEV